MSAAIDWDAANAEALDVMVRYLQIDTTNPPGNEARAARFLGGILEADGIETEYIEIAPGREALIARLRGDGSKRAFMLANHTDVVPVEEAQWDVPPFGGVVLNDAVYGRGAVDMKGFGVMQLVALLALKRSGAELKRDVVYAALPDEEAGSALGMKWICENRPDIVDVEFELNEGSQGSERFAKQDTKLFTVATNEKFGGGVRLTVVGRPGHGSMPHRNNSAVRLMRALIKLDEWDRGLTFTDAGAEYLRRIADEGLLPAPDDREALEAAITASPALHAQFMNTLNITIVNAGIKQNVVPAKSEAYVDCRLLPGQSAEEWTEAIREVIDDDEVTVESTRTSDGFPAVPWDTELFHVIESVVKDQIEDAIVVPGLTIGGTDNRFLRERGIAAYGFIPALYTADELRGFHGNNEHIRIETLNQGCEMTYEITRRLCT
jgi:acetylornithine deacetylase/succinyl-diaminopimelate desuccinylase-like protein